MAPLPFLLLATTLLFTAPLAHSLPDVDAPGPVLPLALVNLTITNNLCDPLTVTIPAAPLESTRSVLIPPGKTDTIAVEPQSPALSPLVLSVRSVEYAAQGDLLTRAIPRAAAETGLAKIVVTSPCAAGEAYLSGLSLAASVEVGVPAFSVPTGTVCARSVSG